MQSFDLARRMQGMSGNVIREILKLTQQGNVISFAGGLPSPDSFPHDTIRAIADAALTKHGTSLLQYATTEGDPLLREAIAGWVSDRGIEASTDNVAILSGSQQGLDLICKAFINPGDTVIVEGPTYLAFLNMLKMFEAQPIHVPGDAWGMDPDLLEQAIRQHKPRIIYLVPTFRNPTGQCMKEERRRQIVDIASRHGIIVVEDDAYGCLRYSGESVPAVKAFYDRGTIYLGSFSKIVAPGLRVGYAIADPALLRPMIIAKQGADIHSSNLSQAIIAGFFAQGLLGPHIEGISKAYGQKRDAMLAALEAHFPSETEFTRPEGGLFIWATLPGAVSTTKMLERAVQERVAYIPGTPFYADGGGDQSMRLNFSNASLEEIEAGIGRLGTVITQELAHV